MLGPEFEPACEAPATLCCVMVAGVSQDLRDERPLTYPGKFLAPAAVEGKKEHFWRRSTLYASGRTELARQMPGKKKMRVVESCSATALPTSTDADPAIKGAANCQLGMDVNLKLLQALLESQSANLLANVSSGLSAKGIQATPL